MAAFIKLGRLVLRVLGLLQHVRAHTRVQGAVKVVTYWRRV